MERTEKLAKIEKFFSQLFCFTSDETLTYLRAVQYFPDKGLSRLLTSLEEGKKQQDQFLADQSLKNGVFVKEMDKLLGNATKKLKVRYEKQEKSGAEKFLQNL